MICHDMIFLDMMCCDVIRYGMTYMLWYDVLRYDMVSYDVIWHLLQLFLFLFRRVCRVLGCSSKQKERKGKVILWYANQI